MTMSLPWLRYRRTMIEIEKLGDEEDRLQRRLAVVRKHRCEMSDRAGQQYKLLTAAEKERVLRHSGSWENA